MEAVDVAPLGPYEGSPRRIECDLLAVSGGFDPVLDLHLHRGRRPLRRGAGLPRARRPARRARGSPAPPRQPRPRRLPPRGRLRGRLGGARRRVRGARARLARRRRRRRRRRRGAAGWCRPTRTPGTTRSSTSPRRHRARYRAAPSAPGSLGRARQALHPDRHGRRPGPHRARQRRRLTAEPPAWRSRSSPPRPPGRRSSPCPSPRSPGAPRPRFDPVRTTPLHEWHVVHGAVFEDVGQWKRPRYYAPHGQGMDAALARECRAARDRVALMDASTLGKIDVAGPRRAELPGAPLHDRPGLARRRPRPLRR